MLVPWFSAWKQTLRNRNQASPSRSRRSCVLRLEELESRLTPNAYTVNILGDASGSVGGQGSGLSGDLRYCLSQAIQDHQADTITFAPSVFSGAAQKTIDLSAALVTGPTGFVNPYGQTAFLVGASDNITIDGSLGANVPGITLNGGGLTRLFAVEGGGTLQLKNLTLTGGHATGGAGGFDVGGAAGGGGAGLGGGVLVDGSTSSFTASGCTFVNNQATGGAGGVAVSGSLQGGSGGGGLGGAGSPAVGSTGGAGGGVYGGAGGTNNGYNGGYGGGGGGAGGFFDFGGVGGLGGGGGGGGDFGYGGQGGFGGGAGGSAGGGHGGGGGFGGGGGGSGTAGFGGGGGGGAGLGGALFSNASSVTLTNDTFTQNAATGGEGGTGLGTGGAGQGEGGAVFVRNGTLVATFDTFSSNTAIQGGTDVAVLSDGSGNRATATLINSILGQNGVTTTSDFYTTTNGGMAANLAASTNNLVSYNGLGINGLPATALVDGTNPNFAAAGLANNGGPTQTIALTAASTSAIGMGATGTGITTDQRGYGRVASPDLGAFEYNAVPPTNVTPPPPIALTPDQKFVQALYQDFLGRSGSSSEVQFWVNLLPNLGQSKVAYDIIHSHEALTRIVNELYLKLLDRSAVGDPASTNWVNALEHGATVGQVIEGILASTEFSNRANVLIGGKNTEANYVKALYQFLLGRDGSPSEVSYWLSVLPSLGATGVANRFLSSSEFRGDLVRQLYGPSEAPSVSIVALFSDLMNRNAEPTPAEVDRWINSGLNIFQIERDFAASPEFFANG